MKRRLFLQGVVALPLFTVKGELISINDSLYINGHIDEKGQHHVAGFDINGKKKFSIPLPNKAHGFAVNPQKPWQVVATPSLPGTKALVFDTKQGKATHIVQSAKKNHFNGHGYFSRDGRLFFSSENIGETAKGIISVRDTTNFDVISEFSSHGIGPHEIALLNDNKTLVIAGGGIKTHPSQGKRELNIDTMKSAVMYIDIESGALLEKIEIKTARLSFRHLDVTPNDDVILACQYKGKKDIPSLIGSHRLGQQSIDWFDVDDNQLWKMKQYTASVKVVNDRIVAVSCPRGNILTLWDYQQKRFVHSLDIADVGGIESSDDGNTIYASANIGELFAINIDTFDIEKLQPNWHQAKWTNHMLRA